MGGELSHVPSLRQMRDESPTNSYPSLQVKVAVSPTETPDSETLPFLKSV